MKKLNNPPKMVHRSTHSIITSSNRTKNEIYNIARANNWEWFATFTFSPNKVADRTNYTILQRKLCKLFDNWKQRKCPNLKYILVPEQHKRLEDNGLHAWHFHALLSDCDGLDIRLIDNKIKYAVDCDDDVYIINDYKLGFCTLTRVKNNDAVTRYITKYITKSLCYYTKHRQRYLVSKNCNRAKEYKYMCMKYNDLSNYNVIDDNVYLSDLLDLSKIVYKKEKYIEIGEYTNKYTYIEVKGDNTPLTDNFKSIQK